MEEFIPPDIMTALSPAVDTGSGRGNNRYEGNSNHGSPLNTGKSRHRHSDCSEDVGNEFIDLLKNVYQDQHAINYAQKEKIATLVLKGEYNVCQKYEPITNENQKRQYDPFFKNQAHSNAIRSRHQLTQRMFELTSQPVAFNSADPEAKKTIAMSRIKELGRGPKHFVSRGKLHETVPLFVPKRKEKQKVSFPSRTDIVSQQISQDAEKVKQFRGHIFDQKGDYAKQKKREIEIRKKITAFKEKLWKRLREKHDPQLSNIMRTLDDTVIFNFIESYKGCTMSVDAILQHIGANVAPSASAADSNSIDEAAPVISPKRIADANGYRLVPRECKSKGAGFRHTTHHKHHQKSQHYFGGRASSAGEGSEWEQRQHLHHISADALLPSMQRRDKVIMDDELEVGGQGQGVGGVLRGYPMHQQAGRHSNSSAEKYPTEAAATLPTLSSTNYGGMYVISSYKDNIK